jgi:hypothetical protein
MAAIFPQIMTRYLEHAAIAGYFKDILRHRVDVPKFTGRWPMLQVYVIDNYARLDAGDGKAVRSATYTSVAAAKLPAGGRQDELIGELVATLETARDALVYDENGVKGRVTLEPWATDESIGHKTGSLVWVEVPIIVSYMNVA